jgi:hypothetical protein
MTGGLRNTRAENTLTVLLLGKKPTDVMNPSKMEINDMNSHPRMYVFLVSMLKILSIRSNELP